MFQVKLNGKKAVRLNLGGMGIQMWQKRKKQPKTWLFQNIEDWGTTDTGFEFTPKGQAALQFTCEGDDGQQISDLMTAKATELATATHAQKEGADGSPAAMMASDTDEGDTSGVTSGYDEWGESDRDSFTASNGASPLEQMDEDEDEYGTEDDDDDDDDDWGDDAESDGYSYRDSDDGYSGSDDDQGSGQDVDSDYWSGSDDGGAEYYSDSDDGRGDSDDLDSDDME